MKVVQIAPPWFPVPPVGYGGIERAVYDLTEGLINAGAEVLLCAPPGSIINDLAAQKSRVRDLTSPAVSHIRDGMITRVDIPMAQESHRYLPDVGSSGGSELSVA